MDEKKFNVTTGRRRREKISGSSHEEFLDKIEKKMETSEEGGAYQSPQNEVRSVREHKRGTKRRQRRGDSARSGRTRSISHDNFLTQMEEKFTGQRVEIKKWSVEQKAEVAEHSDDSSVLDVLAETGEDQRVRALVATNSHSSVNNLRLLSKEGFPVVCLAIVKNPVCDTPLLNEIEDATDNELILEAIQKHPNYNRG